MEFRQRGDEMPHRQRVLLLAALVLLLPLPSALADEVDRALAEIAQTGPQAAGSAAARKACDALSQRGVEVLPRLLAAMETDNPVAANWVRSAFETIVNRELARANESFPVEVMRAYVRDPKHAPRVRRLALAVCDSVEPEFSKKTIPRLLDDPEFREDAVEMALAAGQQALDGGDSETAREEFLRAFEHARDSQQTLRAAGKLTGLGEQVDIAAHLGLVVDWWVVGPFDAPLTSGFAREFPPEKKVDLAEQYVGQEGRTLMWTRHHAADPLGLVNLAQAIAPAKEAVGYAYALLESPSEVAAQLRVGADDNCAVWLNGEKVFGREQWLNGIRFDRFVAPVKLLRGRNTLLVKICQGPQHKDPQVPNNWSLQLRFSDTNGNAVPLRNVSMETAGAGK